MLPPTAPQTRLGPRERSLSGAGGSAGRAVPGLLLLALCQHLEVEGLEALHAQRHAAHLAHHARPLEADPEAGVTQAAQRPGAAAPVLAEDGPREVVAAERVQRALPRLLLLLLLASRSSGGVFLGEQLRRNKCFVVQQAVPLGRR